MKLTEAQLRMLIRRELQEAIPRLVPMSNNEKSRKVKTLKSQLDLAKETAKRMSKWYNDSDFDMIVREIDRVISKLDRVR